VSATWKGKLYCRYLLAGGRAPWSRRHLRHDIRHLHLFIFFPASGTSTFTCNPAFTSSFSVDAVISTSSISSAWPLLLMQLARRRRLGQQVRTVLVKKKLTESKRASTPSI